MKLSDFAFACALLPAIALAQRPVTSTVPDKSAPVHGDLYGSGSRGLVLAHGGRFNKESWKDQATVFANAGFTVLAINFRGDTVYPDGTPNAEGSTPDNAADVLASVRYLHAIGMRSVSAIGASLGGDAVGEADVQSKPGEIDHIVFLASSGADEPEKLKGRKLYIVARGDGNSDGLRITGIRKHFARTPEPKKLVVVEGTAHAQYLFATSEGPEVMNEILGFVSAR
ncbi:MAG: alpha/beta hydrolase [Terracidiphilus sp.]